MPDPSASDLTPRPVTPLLAGTRLGPYEIDSAIGAGGMGEVYKARDTRLGRTVAIKVLPAGVAADPERRRRFEQEARAASALNHPHICVLHDIGDAVPTGPQPPGPGPSSVSYLVLEYLEGQTLAARLAKGKLPVAQALDLGIQVADALGAAHKHGIVHRDLKPANVMLVKGDGGAAGPGALHAKLLDFGLAKLRTPPAAGGLASALTTAPASLTAPGMVLGTLPYMAPEQVEGKDADARTDLWALGLLLYEMLTGQRAFEGTSAASLIGAIMNAEPPALSAREPLTPPALERVVRRCLAKDSDARWQNAADVADELRWIRESGGVGVETGARPQPRRAVRTGMMIAATVVVVAGAVGLTRLLQPSAPAASLTHLTVPVSPAEEVNAGVVSATGVGTPGGSLTAFAWTPDGQTLVFVGRRDGVQQLYVRRLGEAEARPLEHTEGAAQPAVAPDGQWVAFWADDGWLRRVRLSGGPREDFSEPPTKVRPLGLAWNNQGGLLVAYGSRGIWAFPSEGKAVAVTTVREGELQHTLPSLLPGGRVLLYTVRKRESSWGDEQVVAHTLATGERKVLLTNATDARYVHQTGHLVFMRRGVLNGVAFDAGRIEVLGQATPLMEGVVQALTSSLTDDLTGAGQFALSSTGTLAWLPGPVRPPREGRLVTVDRRGQVAPLPAPTLTYGGLVRLSPDQTRLAVGVGSPSETGLRIYDLTRTAPLLPLTAAGERGWPVWARDGQTVFFLWTKDGQRTLASQSTDGTAPPRALIPGNLVPSCVAPDGRVLAVARDLDRRKIVAVALDPSRQEPLFETDSSDYSPEISPGGRWLAYVHVTAGRPEVLVRPYPGPGRPTPVSAEGGNSPAWNPRGGHEIFFVNRVGAGPARMMVATFTDGSPPTIGPPTELFKFALSDLPIACLPTRCYDVSPDGQRFYAVQTVAKPAPPPVTHINLIQNWFEELKAKVPRQ